MTQDEIIEIAKEAGITAYCDFRLESFARRIHHIAATKEREACAMVCDELQAPPHVSDDDMSMWDVTSMECADAIRARGEA